MSRERRAVVGVLLAAAVSLAAIAAGAWLGRVDQGRRAR